ncbi:MAG: hypothetical protein HN975_11870 [Anaerolineae bacterium]|jgi:hypothetical protein|nr:hypothetical protein [Anaerolineae bacterium]
MKYKAKSSYAKAEVNFWTIGSPSKHQILLEGGEVEVTVVPEPIAKHLEESKPIKSKETE